MGASKTNFCEICIKVEAVNTIYKMVVILFPSQFTPVTPFTNMD